MVTRKIVEHGCFLLLPCGFCLTFLLNMTPPICLCVCVCCTPVDLKYMRVTEISISQERSTYFSSAVEEMFILLSQGCHCQQCNSYRECLYFTNILYYERPLRHLCLFILLTIAVYSIPWIDQSLYNIKSLTLKVLRKDWNGSKIHFVGWFFFLALPLISCLFF